MGNRGGGAGRGENRLKKFVERFYCDNTLISYQAMSSPQSFCSQLDPSLTSGVNTLIARFSSLSIEPHREEEVVQARAVKISNIISLFYTFQIHPNKRWAQDLSASPNFFFFLVYTELFGLVFATVTCVVELYKLTCGWERDDRTRKEEERREC